MKPFQLALVTLCTWLPSAFAQHTGATHHEHGAATPARQAHGPYAVMQGRTIKALSEQQLSDLRAGKGMSLALPAEG